MTGTIMLRFRDLVTPPGETLLQHRTLIDRHGYVWWGWWKRPYEEVPTQLFNRLHDVMPKKILLLDTGGANSTFHLYPAWLTDIAQTPTGSAIPPPEPECTPTYYNNNWLHVWFKLGDISVQRMPADVQITIEELPTWPSSISRDIDGYIGVKMKDQVLLRQIDVTLWVVSIDESQA